METSNALWFDRVGGFLQLSWVGYLSSLVSYVNDSRGAGKRSRLEWRFCAIIWFDLWFEKKNVCFDMGFQQLKASNVKEFEKSPRRLTVENFHAFTFLLKLSL